MLFVYYKKTGEIFRATIPEKNLTEFFGEAEVEEASKVFGAVYKETFNQLLFYNFKDCKIVNEKIVIKKGSQLAELLGLDLN